MALNLSALLSDFRQFAQQRIASFFSGIPGEKGTTPWESIEINEHHGLLQLLPSQNFTAAEYLSLIIGLISHVDPNFFDELMRQALPNTGDFPQLGGVRGKNFRGFLPTGETALFLLAGEDLEKRLEVQEMFGPEHFFSKTRILWLEDVPAGEPRMSGKIILAQEYIDLFTTGRVSRPTFNAEFPAKLIETDMTWDDLVLDKEILTQIRELEIWVKHNEQMLHDWGLRKRIKPGYRVLFHGPPGTGKTLTASLLGKYTEKEVYRIDLSTVVSKYIGETEKNLSTLFDRAEDKNWILFFDEADSLFGKRTNVRDAHDKYANQEVSYLLQRLEDFNGLVILASNMKSNIDDAFMRRFNAIIKFPMPDERERILIWQKCFPEIIQFEVNGTGKALDVPRIAAKYELSGGSIINVVHYACLNAMSSQTETITWDSVRQGIQREFAKEGRVFKDLGR